LSEHRLSAVHVRRETGGHERLAVSVGGIQKDRQTGNILGQDANGRQQYRRTNINRNIRINAKRGV